VDKTLAVQNICKCFTYEGITQQKVMRLLDRVTQKYISSHRTIVLFFFYRSLSNQILYLRKKPSIIIQTNEKSLELLLSWYFERHIKCIDPIDADNLNFSIPSKLEQIINHQNPDYEDYSVDDWKWKEVSSTSEKEYKKWLRRRERIIARGSQNTTGVHYTPYSLVRSLSEFSKGNIKNANALSKIFNTDEYWGFYSFPYLSPSPKYDLFRAIGSLLWSVSQNQYHTTKNKMKVLKKNQVRFEHIESFTSYGTERTYKAWRFPFYLDKNLLKHILINISNKYPQKFINTFYKKGTGFGSSKGTKPAPTSFYIQSFNFGIEAPPTVLPPLGYNNLVSDYYKDVGFPSNLSFTPFIADFYPTHVWKENE
jgi:hypothetical protein